MRLAPNRLVIGLVVGPVVGPAAWLLACSNAPTRDEGEHEPKPAVSDAYPYVVATAGKTAKVGAPAPEFSLKDIDGKEHSLSALRGKVVVLEWFNPGCPFVNHAHTEGSLKAMAKEEIAKGVVWLAINSGAAGKQGHGADANRTGAEKFGMPHPILIDESGQVGHLYGAEKTPHMMLIDAEGILRYRGAIDNAPFGEVDGGGTKINYLAQALADLRGNKPVSTTETRAYGCTVKYGKG